MTSGETVSRDGRRAGVAALENGTGAMSEKANENEFELVRGSGTIVRDLTASEADLKQAKAVLAARVIAVLDARKPTVRKAATATGFAAADFSRLWNADLGRFTLDRLIRMLGALDDGVAVTVHVGRRAG